MSLTSETATVETHVDAGTSVFDGRTIDIPAADLVHDDGDVDYPRWDTICIVNDEGGLQIYKGTPEPVVTDADGNELRGEQAYTPSPSDSIPNTVIPIAMVWIPSGASSNSDLTNTSAGGVENPIIDRRITQRGQAEQETYHTGPISSSGWYRIATIGDVTDGGSGGGQADALFTIRSRTSGMHGIAVFRAAIQFNQDPTLTLLHSAGYGGTVGAFTDLRIVHGQTYEGAAVEARVDLHSQSQINNVKFSLYQNRALDGWVPTRWTAGSVPTGFSTTVLPLANVPMLAAAREGNNFEVDNNGRAVAEEVYPRQLGMKVEVDANTIVPANTEHRIPFNTVIRDPRGSFDPSSHLYTVPFDGIYKVNLTCGWLGTSNFSGPTQIRNFIRNTTTSTILSQAFDMGDSSAVNVSIQILDELELTAGDQLEAIAFHKGDGDASMNDGSDWVRWLIRPIGGPNL